MAITTVSSHVVSVNAIQGTLIADNAITAGKITLVKSPTHISTEVRLLHNPRLAVCQRHLAGRNQVSQ